MRKCTGEYWGALEKLTASASPGRDKALLSDSRRGGETVGRGFRASALVPRKNAGEREGKETPGVSPLGTEHQLDGKLQLPRNLKGALTTNACAQPVAGTVLGEESPRRRRRNHADGLLTEPGAHSRCCVLCVVHTRSPQSFTLSTK